MSGPLELSLGRYRAAPQAWLARFAHDHFAERLWKRDPTLWSPDAAHQKVAANRLGWIESPRIMAGEANPLQGFTREVLTGHLRRCVILGMGGSSLAPEVLRTCLGHRALGIDLEVLDNTSPAAVRSVTERHDPTTTLFMVSSKSGGTIEVVSFERHFWEWVHAARGSDAGKSFVAITDPGTSLEALAKTRGYRRCFLNPADIGGRYSALSYFGLVPAALLGHKLQPILASAEEERAKNQGPADAPGPAFLLGAALGGLAAAGRDKLTLVLGPEIASLGSWIEQLVAESTGKTGKGILPVAEEDLARPDVYGEDRVFVAVNASPTQESALAELETAGHPVISWRLDSLVDLGAEFLRWEIATATAAGALGVDPFDEPDVTAAKQATQEVLDRALAGDDSPRPSALGTTGEIRAFAPEATAAALGVRAADDVGAWLDALLGLARPGDYVALLAYLHRTPELHQRLQRLRHACRAATRAATTLGYGPRYLHSTGQLHKGGPDTGLFLLLTADEGDDVPIPGERYGFATLRDAQAAGDDLALARRGRRVLRMHLGAEPERALDELIRRVGAATRV